MYTTSTIFLKALSEAGITHVFVNWGSDHPAMLEELAQRSKDGRCRAMKIITCPNEMAGLSAAQGFAQVTGRPAAVIVHVDVGTQALAQAVHSLDRARVPVLIYAGASPSTTNGEVKGSRNEWIMWGQDVPDQSAIVRQYMRTVMQINSGKNIREVVMRCLQMATSDPKGPVYLWARREVMEEEVDESFVDLQINPKKWTSLRQGALSKASCSTIAEALRFSKSPLIISQYVGRNPRAVQPLQSLSRLLSIPIFVSCPTTVCVPFSEDNFVGLSFSGQNPLLADADVVLVVDADVPWIPMTCKPQQNARVFVIDCDPLKERMGMGIANGDAEMVCKADAEVALYQILEEFGGDDWREQDVLEQRRKRVTGVRTEWIKSLDCAEVRPLGDSGPITVPQLMAVLRSVISKSTADAGKKVLVLNEAVTGYPAVWSHMQIDTPGNMLCSGSSALGWALGAAVGAKLAEEHELVVAIVGDGCFIFANPTSVYWMSRKYQAPFLTVVLNNGGWRAPKMSMKSLYPTGRGADLTGDELTIGFSPCPDYSNIATAAGGAWGSKVEKYEHLADTMTTAIRKVKEGVSAVVDCVVEPV